jgi:hypothetical protein
MAGAEVATGGRQVRCATDLDAMDMIDLILKFEIDFKLSKFEDKI